MFKGLKSQSSRRPGVRSVRWATGTLFWRPWTHYMFYLNAREMTKTLRKILSALRSEDGVWNSRVELGIPQVMHALYLQVEWFYEWRMANFPSFTCWEFDRISSKMKGGIYHFLYRDQGLKMTLRGSPSLQFYHRGVGSRIVIIY